MASRAEAYQLIVTPVFVTGIAAFPAAKAGAARQIPVAISRADADEEAVKDCHWATIPSSGTAGAVATSTAASITYDLPETPIPARNSPPMARSTSTQTATIFVVSDSEICCADAGHVCPGPVIATPGPTGCATVVPRIYARTAMDGPDAAIAGHTASIPPSRGT